MTWTSDLTQELASGRYEITVVGSLGPVLRAALHPLVTTASGPCTTLRTALGRRGDVADLVALLDAKGLEVTHVAVRQAHGVGAAADGHDPLRGPDTVHPTGVTRSRPWPRGLERWPSTRR